MVKEPSAPKLCLVVDDSRVIRKVARRILEDLGLEVAEAGDGVEALAWVRAAVPDVILLDWHMPVMNGMEFLSRLRQEPLEVRHTAPATGRAHAPCATSRFRGWSSTTRTRPARFSRGAAGTPASLRPGSEGLLKSTSRSFGRRKGLVSSASNT